MMSRIDEIFKKRVPKKYEIEKIGLFGSYARDEAHQDSDIDIFV